MSPPRSHSGEPRRRQTARTLKRQARLKKEPGPLREGRAVVRRRCRLTLGTVSLSLSQAEPSVWLTNADVSSQAFKRSRAHERYDGSGANICL